MSNWEPEEVSDADMEDIAGGAGGKKPTKKPEEKDSGANIDGGEKKKREDLPYKKK